MPFFALCPSGNTHFNKKSGYSNCFFYYLTGMQDKKSIEQVVLHKFIGLFQEFPAGRITAGESPDFLLRANTGKAIGIELTELRGQDFLNHTHGLIEPRNILYYIEKTIQSKEKKIYLYRKNKLFQLWLLIHLDSFGPAINFKLENKLTNLHIHSGFDRIFLLELTSEKLFEFIEPITP